MKSDSEKGELSFEELLTSCMSEDIARLSARIHNSILLNLIAPISNLDLQELKCEANHLKALKSEEPQAVGEMVARVIAYLEMKEAMEAESGIENLDAMMSVGAIVELTSALKAAITALGYAFDNYCPLGAIAEINAICNGYGGSPDIYKIYQRYTGEAALDTKKEEK